MYLVEVRESSVFSLWWSWTIDYRLGLFLEHSRDLAQLLERIPDLRKRASEIVRREPGTVCRFARRLGRAREVCGLDRRTRLVRKPYQCPFGSNHSVQFRSDLLDLRTRRCKE